MTTASSNGLFLPDFESLFTANSPSVINIEPLSDHGQGYGVDSTVSPERDCPPLDMECQNVILPEDIKCEDATSSEHIENHTVPEYKTCENSAGSEDVVCENPIMITPENIKCETSTASEYRKCDDRIVIENCAQQNHEKWNEIHILVLKSEDGSDSKTDIELGQGVRITANIGSTGKGGRIIANIGSTEKGGRIIANIGSTGKVGRITANIGSTKKPGRIIANIGSTEKPGRLIANIGSTEKSGRIKANIGSREKPGRIIANIGSTEQVGRIIANIRLTEKDSIKASIALRDHVCYTIPICKYIEQHNSWIDKQQESSYEPRSIIGSTNPIGKHHVVLTHQGENRCTRCMVCGMEFFLPCQLRSHQTKCTESSQYERCGKTTMQNCAFSHQCSEAVDKSFTCSKFLNTGNDGVKHQSTKKIRCNMQFTEVEAFIRHQRSHVNGKSPRQTVSSYYIGGQVSKTKGHLDTHKGTHTKEKTFECNECGKFFNRKSNLVSHQRTHTGEKPYACNICSKRFTQSNSCNYHQATVHAVKPHNCSVCGKEFKNPADLATHQLFNTGDDDEKHQSTKILFRCNADRCNMEFTEDTYTKTYKCNECGKMFNRKRNLVSHHRTHTREKHYACNVCGKRFAHSHSRNNHQLIHIGEKTYKCSVCCKRFLQKCYLRNHQRMHTGEKPYLCSVCGKRFRASTNLRLHQSVHTGERPYTCTVCGKGFRLYTGYKVHQRTHTGEKPYACNVCGKRFSMNSHRNYHQLTVHTEKAHKCSVCGKAFRRLNKLRLHFQIHKDETS